MEFSVEKVVEKMKSEKKIFVSEKHLQTEFISTAKSIKEYENYDFVPEYPHREGKANKHIDLVISDGNECMAIEFKYVSAGGTIPILGNENYKLKNHGAVNIRRYQCVKDIVRLEDLKEIAGLKCVGGYLLLITNMDYFWKGTKIDGASKQFDIKDEDNLNAGEHQLTKGKDAKRYEPLSTQNSYHLHYEDYYNEGESKEFKYLIVEVK